MGQRKPEQEYRYQTAPRRPRARGALSLILNACYCYYLVAHAIAVIAIAFSSGRVNYLASLTGPWATSVSMVAFINHCYFAALFFLGGGHLWLSLVTPLCIAQDSTHGLAAPRFPNSSRWLCASDF